MDGRWSRQILDWEPGVKFNRDPGRPRTRWTDSIEQYAGGDWKTVAQDEDLWATLEPGFVQHLS